MINVGGGPTRLEGLERTWNTASPVSAWRSFGMRVQRYVAATCAEVDCHQWANGWATTVIPGSEDAGLVEQACDGRVDGRTRAWARLEPLPDGFVRIWFEPGQPCFKAAQHRIPWAGRWYHRDGDWRGNPSGLVVAHADARSWVDEFGEHQLKLVANHDRG
jgi:hypothetical protein